MLKIATKLQPKPSPILSPAYSQLEALTLSVYDRCQLERQFMPLPLVELWAQAEWALKFGDDDYLALISYLFQCALEETSLCVELPTLKSLAVGKEVGTCRASISRAF